MSLKITLSEFFLAFILAFSFFQPAQAGRVVHVSASKPVQIVKGVELPLSGSGAQAMGSLTSGVETKFDVSLPEGVSETPTVSPNRIAIQAVSPAVASRSKKLPNALTSELGTAQRGNKQRKNRIASKPELEPPGRKKIHKETARRGKEKSTTEANHDNRDVFSNLQAVYKLKEDAGSGFDGAQPDSKGEGRASVRDSFGTYLNEIGDIELLNPEQERELAALIIEGNYAHKRLENAGLSREEIKALSTRTAKGRKVRLRLTEAGFSNGDIKTINIQMFRGQRALNDLVQANLRLVVRLARRYAGQWPGEFPDLVAEGNFGLFQAAERFDPFTYEDRFSTHAWWWIRAALQHAVEKAQAANRRNQQFGYRDDGLNPSESIPDKNLGPEEVAANQDQAQLVRKVLAKMYPREALVLSLRSGIDPRGPMTLEQIGNILKRTKEAARKMELRAQKHFRTIMLGQ